MSYKILRRPDVPPCAELEKQAINISEKGGYRVLVPVSTPFIARITKQQTHSTCTLAAVCQFSRRAQPLEAVQSQQGLDLLWMIVALTCVVLHRCRTCTRAKSALTPRRPTT